MAYLSKQALSNLQYYKYSSVDKSLLVKWFLSDFWNWIVSWCPKWLAPNTITMIGFAVLLANFGISIYYAPNIDAICPPWVYASFCFALFFYQIMDNIDGRQARRTGSSSPLGELVDHGCDSLYVLLSSVMQCTAMRYTAWESIFFLNCCILPFYFSHWEEWYTGMLILSTVGNPTEAQLLQCVGHLFSLIAGPEFWTEQAGDTLNKWTDTDLFGIANFIQCNYIPLVIITPGAVVAAIFNAKAVFGELRAKKLPPLSSLKMLLPYVIVVGCSVGWFLLSPSKIAEHHTVACMSFEGLLFAYALDRMMIDRVTKVPFNVFSIFFLIPFAGLAVGILSRTYAEAAAYEVTALYALLAFVVACYVHMVVHVVRELCAYLGIYCFVITAKPPVGRQGTKSD